MGPKRGRPKVHAAVDALEYPLALAGNAANASHREQIDIMAKEVPE
jgi:hypothetical protein